VTRPNVKISDAEIDYLCDGASQYFSEPVTRDDIVWTFSGVRPLYDDGASKAQEATRDYVLRADGGAEAKVINVFGGKITTYRRLAESVLRKVEDALGAKGRAWTRESVLPGGEFGVEGFAPLLAESPLALPVPAARPKREACPRLRSQMPRHPRRRTLWRGSRRGLRPRTDRGGGPLSDETRIRTGCRGCGVAQEQARHSLFTGAARPAKGFHGRKQTTAAPCSGIGISDAGTEKRQQESRSGSAHR
jgi:hypothetical protein